MQITKEEQDFTVNNKIVCTYLALWDYLHFLHGVSSSNVKFQYINPVTDNISKYMKSDPSCDLFNFNRVFNANGKSFDESSTIVIKPSDIV